MKKRKKSFLENMSWIFIGNVAHAILSFLINILVARSLTTNDNGIINYATSWISFYNAIAALGINSVINKFTTDDIKKSNKYLFTAICFRVISGIIGTILVIVTVFIVNPTENTILAISGIQALSIIFSAGDTLVFWFQFKREANIVAKLRLIAFFLSAVVKIVSIVVYKNIYLYTFGIVLETLLFSILLIFKYRRNYTKDVNFSTEAIIKILKVSYPFVFSAVLATIYAQTDKIMLKNMMDNDAVAYYSIAVTLAGLMSIVVSAIIEGFRPEIIAEKNKGNDKLYEKRLKQVYGITFWICIIYGIFVSLFAKYIILILYGKKYLPAQPALSLIVWYTSFSYFGTINNIYMVAEEKEKWVTVTTLMGAIANVLLNILLIPSFGIKGAALASLLTQILANFIIPAIVTDLRPITKYILKGITLDGIQAKNFILTIIDKF